MSELNKLRSFFIYQCPFIIWCLLIFVSSAIPSAELPRFVFKLSDKLLHSILFLVLAALAYRALTHQDGFPSLSRHALSITAAFTLFYGVSDEVHQLFVAGRNASVYDVAADVGGGLVFVLIIKISRAFKHGKDVSSSI